MPIVDLRIDEEGAWKDMADNALDIGDSFAMMALTGGMSSGRTSVAFRFTLPDGKIAFCQTSLRMLQVCVNGLTAKYGDETL